jgi:Na+/H+-dicarboxylate symporter
MKLHLPSQTTQVLVALVVGILVGCLFPGVGSKLGTLSVLFIRLILVIVGPLVFFALVTGIADLGRSTSLGGIVVRTAFYFLLLTGLALLLGFAAGLIIQPGVGMLTAEGNQAVQVLQSAGQGEEFLVRLFPTSIVDAMARGDILQIVGFAVFFGVALRSVGARGEAVLALCRAMTAVMFRLTGYIMTVAPLGVLGAAASVIGTHGVGVLASYVKLATAVALGLLTLLLIVFPALALVHGVRLISLLRAVKEALIIAFGTASSSAALPEAMASLEQAGLPRRTVSFVLSTGLSFNLAGTTLFMGVAALFIAQAYRITLSSGQLLQLFFTIFALSKGTPTVPRGSLVLIGASLENLGFPREIVAGGIGLLLGIDPLLDMARAATNVAGNCLAVALVAPRSDGGEGEGEGIQ